MGTESPRRQRLAARLKSHRRQRGISGEQLAAQLGWSQSKVSKIENGRTCPSVGDVTVWLRTLHVVGPEQAELLELAEAVQTEATAWRALYRSGFVARQRAYAEMEAEARELLIYQPTVVPGLFQTAEYARRVLTLFGLIDVAEIGAAVTARLERQSVLYDETKTIDAVITEAALRWRPGPLAISLAQMDRLLSMTTLPNVTIGVVPLDAEASAIPVNQFVIFHGADGLDVVSVETYTAEVSVTEPEAVNTYREIFKRHQTNALRGEAAVELIEKLSSDIRRSS